MKRNSGLDAIFLYLFFNLYAEFSHDHCIFYPLSHNHMRQTMCNNTSIFVF